MPQDLKITNLSPTIGAEVEGFDPSGEVDDEAWKLLSEAFDERALLVFRDLELDPAMQHRIVERLYASGAEGDAERNADAGFSYVSNTEPDGGSPYGRLLFHSDMMWSDIPHQVPSLYAVAAEQPPTPTIFVSSVNAWSTLPDELRERVEGLHARHESGPQGRGDNRYEDELIQPNWDQLRDTVTPVANVHPRTGDTMLYVCEQQTREIVELSSDEGDELLDALFAHLSQDDLMVAHQWRPGDLVIWDNMAAQHGRPYVEGDGPARTLRKIHAPAGLAQRIGHQPTYDPKD